MQRSVRARPFLLLATDERDALSILTEACEDIAILGFRLILRFGDPDKATANESHGSACNERIEDCGEDEETWNVEVHACGIQVKRCAYGPQHRDKCHGGQKSLRYTAHEIYGRIRGDAHIIGDAVFRV